MKYVEPFREPERVRRAAATLAATCTRPWKIMEVCGGQTHAIARYAIDDLLPDSLKLVHGPGCPVCVTPVEVIAHAQLLSLKPDVTLCTFGDMLRVPGPGGDLVAVRARGADVRLVLSPLDAVKIARANPERQVVFFAVGFETTAPSSALSVELARRLELSNYSLLVAHVRVAPAMELLLSAPDNEVQGFLAAGHVCTIEGTSEYPALAARYRVPIVVTGFEPLDILLGVREVVRQLEAGQADVTNRYERAVKPDGNPRARAMVDRVFEVADVAWRGLGPVKRGGLKLRRELADFDATRVHGPIAAPMPEPTACRAAEVLRGRLEPIECQAFGRQCTPETPLGAPMVSTEGACAAYFRFRPSAARAGGRPARAVADRTGLDLAGKAR